jgi:hypothetical protein
VAGHPEVHEDQGDVKPEAVSGRIGVRASKGARAVNALE